MAMFFAAVFPKENAEYCDPHREVTKFVIAGKNSNNRLFLAKFLTINERSYVICT